MSVEPGQIIILNGAPRAGKSSIVKAIQESFDGIWMNLGVDVFNREITPQNLWPGIGLRPHAGAQCLEIEEKLPQLYAALYEAIAALSQQGLNVVVDIGHHDAYQKPRHILADCAQRLSGLPVVFVGVRCPVETIMARRNEGQAGCEGIYVQGTDENPVPEPVQYWQEAVHIPGIYDLEVDTAIQSPEDCAKTIGDYLRSGTVPTAFQEIIAQN